MISAAGFETSYENIANAEGQAEAGKRELPAKKTKDGAAAEEQLSRKRSATAAGIISHTSKDAALQLDQLRM